MVLALVVPQPVSCFILFFFFFQAEDGIRDLTVTGVQTCALPIFWRRLLAGEAVDFDGKYFKVKQGRNFFPPVQKPHPPLYFGGSSDAAHDLAARQVDAYLTWGEPPAAVAEKFADIRRRAAQQGRQVRLGVRSEERRVGKECRSRWSPY